MKERNLIIGKDTKIPIIILGVSMGGVVTCLMALKNPKNYKLLILMSPAIS